ncbi:MAG: endolytic transglycosylase MltG [Actinomycetes bacterium]
MKGKLPLVSVIGVLLGVAMLISSFLHNSSDFSVGHPGTEISFDVADGATGSDIAIALAAQKVIKNSKTFYKLALSDSRAGSIAPGSHRIETHIPSALALTELLDSKRIVGLLVVKEGSTFSDVIGALKQSSAISPFVLAKLKIAPPIANPSNSLEGLLYPAHYSFAKGTTAKSAIAAMSAKFTSVAAGLHLSNGYESYSGYQVLTIASMVQVEADSQDFAKVARVIMNRLRIGMPLQLNSTVQYATNQRGKIQLSTKSTQIDSPYNTYRNVGLPPTPISNPSSAALGATLHPAAGNWIYFITVKPGDTRFTNSYSEFSKWELLFHQNLAAGAFK